MTSSPDKGGAGEGFIFRCVFFLAALCVLVGCASPPASPKVEPPPAAQPPPYASTDVGDLLRFAGETAALPRAARFDQCRQLRQLARSEPSPGVRLHLLLAQSVTEACVTPREASALGETTLAEAGDERLKAFLVYHKTLLARLDRETEKRKTLERQISQSMTQQKQTHRRLKSQESELKGLQKKLDALKAIEQSLDEPSSGQ